MRISNTGCHRSVTGSITWILSSVYSVYILYVIVHCTVHTVPKIPETGEKSKKKMKKINCFFVVYFSETMCVTYV